MEYKYALTVIVPCFNCKGTIYNTVKSIVDNSPDNIEVILVDDGSTDGTDALLRDIEKDNIRVIYKENGGVSSARNAGIDLAQGEYIGFVDSDDIVTNRMFFELLEVADKKRCDIVQGNFAEKWGDKIVPSKFRYSFDYLSGADTLERFYQGEVSIAIWDKIFRSDCIKNNNICFNTEYKIGEDIIFCIECLKVSDVVGFVDKQLYIYIQNVGSAVHHISPNILQLTQLRRAVHDTGESFEYFMGLCWLRCFHTISENYYNDKENRGVLKEYMIKIMDKKVVALLVKDRKTSRFIKLELLGFKLFGVNFHLKMYGFYRFVRNRIR